VYLDVVPESLLALKKVVTFAPDFPSAMAWLLELDVGNSPKAPRVELMLLRLECSVPTVGVFLVRVELPTVGR
jgi:hypothetical protein